jgi:hypothetical protein
MPNLVALAAILCEDMADRCDEEVACGSRFKIHGGPTVGKDTCTTRRETE